MEKWQLSESRTVENIEREIEQNDNSLEYAETHRIPKAVRQHELWKSYLETELEEAKKLEQLEDEQDAKRMVEDE